MGLAFHGQFRCHDLFGIMVTLSDDARKSERNTNAIVIGQ